jgi:hypothetical protein
MARGATMSVMLAAAMVSRRPSTAGWTGWTVEAGHFSFYSCGSSECNDPKTAACKEIGDSS